MIEWTRNPDIVERFWFYVEKTTNCWSWKGHIGTLGYGQFRFNYKRISPHRFSYEIHKGKIPKGLVIDHLCRNPKCVNPDHLEVVTRAENVMRGFSPHAINARKTHCKKGHKLDESRKCKKCQKMYRLNRIKYGVHGVGNNVI